MRKYVDNRKKYVGNMKKPLGNWDLEKFRALPSIDLDTWINSEVLLYKELV